MPVWLSFPPALPAGPTRPLCTELEEDAGLGLQGWMAGPGWPALLCALRILKSLPQETTWSALRPPEAWRRSPAPRRPTPPTTTALVCWVVHGSLVVPDPPGWSWQEGARAARDEGRELCVSRTHSE